MSASPCALGAHQLVARSSTPSTKPRRPGRRVHHVTVLSGFTAQQRNAALRNRRRFRSPTLEARGSSEPPHESSMKSGSAPSKRDRRRASPRDHAHRVVTAHLASHFEFGPQPSPTRRARGLHLGAVKREHARSRHTPSTSGRLVLSTAPLMRWTLDRRFD